MTEKKLNLLRSIRPLATRDYRLLFAAVGIEVFGTGVWTIVDFTGVADVGTVIHPNSLGGQINGGSIQGIGHVRSQKLVYDPHYGAGLSTRVLDFRSQGVHARRGGLAAA